jgi:hypothetical protein
MLWVKRFDRDRLIAVCLILFAAVLALHWMQPGKIVYAGDTFWLSDPLNYLRKHVFLWNSYLSITGKPRCGLLQWPQLLLISALTNVFGNSAGQMLSIGLMIGVGFAAMYFILRLERFAIVPSVLGAAAYTFNPWTMATLPFAWTILWCFATAPAIVAALLVAARYPRYRIHSRIALVLLSAVPLSIVALNAGVMGIEIMLILMGAWLAASRAADRRSYLRWMAFTAGYMVLVSLWWLFPVASMFLSSTASATVVGPALDWTWVVRRASLDNVARFLPFWTWGFPNYLTYSRDYDANPLTYGSSFALIVLGIASIVVRKPERATLSRLAFGIALLALFLSKGVHEPASWFFELIYKLPGAAIWKEPTTKFPLIAIAALAICSAIVFERLLATSRRALLRRAVVGICAVTLAVSSEALFIGPVYSEETLQMPSSYVTIPQYWYDAAAWVNAQPPDGAIMTLPADAGYQVGYTWGMRAVDMLPSDVFHRQTIVLGDVDYVTRASDETLVSLVNQMFSHGDRNMTELLHRLGVRYVAYRGDIDQEGSVVMSLDDVRRRLPGAAVHQFGALAVLDIGPATSPAEADRFWVAGDYGGLSMDMQYELTGDLENAPRVDVRDLHRHGPVEAPGVYEVDAAQVGAAFPGDETASKLVAGSKIRYLWTAPTHRFDTVVSNAAPTAVELRDNDDVRSVPKSTLTFPAALLPSPDPPQGATLLSLVGLEESDSRHTTWSVANPSFRDVTADVQVAVSARQPTSYVLALGERTYIDSLSGQGGRIVWAKFNDVVFSPGLNQLIVSRSKATGGHAAEAATSLEVGAIRAHVTSGSPGTPAAAVAKASGIVLDSHDLRHVDFASVALDVPLSETPIISIDAPPMFAPAELGATITFSNGGRTYRCYGPFDGAHRLDLKSAIIGCADVAGIVVGTDFLNATTVLRADLVAMIFPGAPQVAISPVLNSASASWQAGFASELLSPVKVTAQGLTVPVLPAQDADAYQVFLTPPTVAAEAAAREDLVGAYVRAHLYSGDVEGFVVNDTADILQLKSPGGVQDIRRSSIESLMVSADIPRVTVSFDPSSLSASSLLGFGVSGLPVDSAFLGHYTDGGRFVQDVDVTALFSSDTPGPKLIMHQPEFAQLSDSNGRRIALRFALYAKNGPDSNFMLNARVSSAEHGTVQVAVGSQSANVAQNSVRRFDSQERLVHIAVDDRSDGATVGAIGYPRVDRVGMAPVTLHGHPELLGWTRAGDEFVQLRQGYSKSWAGVCLGSCWPFPAHVRDESGWNDWWVSGSGVLVITNFFVVLQWLTALISLAVLLLVVAHGQSATRVRRRTVNQVPIPDA